MLSSCRRSAVFCLVVCALGAATLAPGAVAAPSPVQKLGDRALRLGAKGPDVRQLQEALQTSGFKVKVDGRFGPGTVRAVKRFQRAARLEPSGTVGVKTVQALRRALQGAGASVNGGFDPARPRERRHSLGDRIPLREGMSGQDIRVLQDFLRREGFKVGIDGEFGASTLRAVEAFQRANELEVDGVVHAADINVLRTLVEGDDPGEQPLPATTTAPTLLAEGDRATIGADGLVLAPASAPEAVKQIIAAGNVIAKKAYRYGGGHGRWNDTGYDCSGSVSYALHGAALLDSPLASGDFMSWGDAGPGQWVTIYSNPGHMYMVVAGLRFDTSGRSRGGTRWQADLRSTSGYKVRHPPGL